MKKCRQIHSSAKNKQKEKLIGREMMNYCEGHAIFFYHVDDHEKRLIPQRKDSSRVQLNGLVRHRGSMLDLLYDTPDYEEIQMA